MTSDPRAVDAVWRRIETFFAERAPDAPPFPPPANEAEVRAWEERLGRQLPDDHRRWLLHCSGADTVRLGNWETLTSRSSIETGDLMRELCAAGLAPAWNPPGCRSLATEREVC